MRQNCSVEGSHRAAAWRIVLDHVDAPERVAVVQAMRECLDAWVRYRDDVAAACGLSLTDDDAGAATPVS